MKKFLSLINIIAMSLGIVVISFGIFSCTSSLHDPVNGWYHLDGHSDKPIGKPFATIEDFAWLILDSGEVAGSDDILYHIVGKIREDRIDTFAVETGKAVGKQIGFLYDGKVVHNPRVNMPLSAGRFSINLYPGYDSEKANAVFRDLRQQLANYQRADTIMTSDDMARFDSLYVAWRENYFTNPATMFSSNTSDAKNLEQYPLLMDMGKKIIPSIITRLPVRSDYFALTLYDDLQDVDSLKCPPHSASEHERVQITLKKYIEAKTGKKKRGFASDTEKIAAIKKLIAEYNWTPDSTYTEAERDSMILDMDYEITESLFQLMKGE